MATRLQLRVTIRERLEEAIGTPIWSDAARNESLAATILAYETSFPRQATDADPNDIEAEVIACTVRPGGSG